DPRQSPQEYIDRYPLDEMELPSNWLPEYPYQEAIGNGPSLRDEALAPFPRTAYALKKHLQEYYAIITHLDDQIGRILDTLEANGQMENTYIFFTSDHGLAVGRHGLLGKQSLFDHSIRVPLVLVGKDIPKGQKIDADVYLQDIMATSLELAGIEKPPYVDFHSFLDLAKGQRAESAYDGVYGAYVDRQRMIRKDGFKLIVYPSIQKVLLFDLNKDPEETTDLAGEETYRNKVKSLFSDLLEKQKQLGDPLDLSAMQDDI
ncbi:MAG: sulfatase-like hydrolase/transferase, partial [Bacteroidota bacterium]